MYASKSSTLLPSSTVTLATPYGPAAFRLTLRADGSVAEVVSATAGLPEAVFRLSYGDRWEDAREHFQLLADLVPYMAETAIWLADVPEDFRAVRRAFRGAGAERPVFPREAAGLPDHLARAGFWLAHPAGRSALFRQRSSGKGFASLIRVAERTADELRVLEPWLFAVLPLLTDTEETSRAYSLLAAIGTPTARDFLFGELERAGRHPAANLLLAALRYLGPATDQARIVRLYDAISGDADLMPRYLRLLEQFTGSEVWDVTLQALADHPQHADAALRTLRQTNYPTPERAIRRQFDREENYFLLDLIAELIADAEPDVRVSLADMNARVDTPLFTDGAQVTWPQMLEPNWAALVKATPAGDLFPLIGKYLDRREGRLQRNALLQLRVWLEQSGAVSLPQPIEDRLRELIDSRYDKVSTVALDVFAKTIAYSRQPAPIVDALLRHSLTSQYRIMAVAPLKAVATDAELRQRQIRFYRATLAAASSEEDLSGLARIAPYLGFLGLREELRAGVTARRAEQRG